MHLHQSARLDAAAEAARTKWDGPEWSERVPWSGLAETQRIFWRRLVEAAVAAYTEDAR